MPIKKELDNDKTITYKLKFIDSFRFMATSLSNLIIIIYLKFIKLQILKITKFLIIAKRVE